MSMSKKILAQYITDSCLDSEKLDLLKKVFSFVFSEEKSSSRFYSFNKEPADIGIWSYQDEQWIRNEAYYNEWSCWADIPVLRKKSPNSHRTLLLGESNARAYLYDPVVTLASALEKQLNINSDQNHEVLDLARIDITAAGVRRLMTQILPLHPDTIVFMCGNNWIQLESLGPNDCLVLSQLLKDKGIEAARSYFIDECVTPDAKSTLNLLNSLVQELDANVVLVIPEFNLGDWRLDENLSEFMLPDVSNMSPKTFQDSADKAIKANDAVCAKIHLQSARDGVMGLPIRFSPRCPAIIQSLFRDFGEQYRFLTVDLPVIFEGLTDNGIPGKELFIDYCHLNLNGLGVLVSHLVSAISSAGDKQPQDCDIAISPTDLAASYFMAAIHNAHYGQPYDSILHYCDLAIFVYPEAKDMFALYLSIVSAHSCVPWMHVDFIKLINFSPIIKCYLLPKNPSMSLKLFDENLHRAMSVAMNVPYKLPPDSNQPIDLLDPAHWARSLHHSQQGDLSLSAIYFMAREKCTSFYFYCSPSCSFDLALSLRLPEISSNKKVKIVINGHEITEFHASHEWLDCIVKINADKLSLRNELKIIWPDSLDFSMESEYANALSRFEMPVATKVSGHLMVCRLLDSQHIPKVINKFDECVAQ